MNSLIINSKHIPPTRNCCFRFVEESDADYILNLRLNGQYNEHLSRVDNNLSKQIEWIKLYKERESRLKEFYIIVENLNGKKIGTFRIYDINENYFSWGSWIIENSAPKSSAIESLITSYFIGFEALGFNNSKFDVRNENKKVISIHEKLGSQLIGKDDVNHYFIFHIDAYKKIKKKYSRYLEV